MEKRRGTRTVEQGPRNEGYICEGVVVNEGQVWRGASFTNACS